MLSSQRNMAGKIDLFRKEVVYEQIAHSFTRAVRRDDVPDIRGRGVGEAEGRRKLHADELYRENIPDESGSAAEIAPWAGAVGNGTSGRVSQDSKVCEWAAAHYTNSILRAGKKGLRDRSGLSGVRDADRVLRILLLHRARLGAPGAVEVRCAVAHRLQRRAFQLAVAN